MANCMCQFQQSITYDNLRKVRILSCVLQKVDLHVHRKIPYADFCPNIVVDNWKLVQCRLCRLHTITHVGDALVVSRVLNLKDDKIVRVLPRIVSTN